MIFRYTCIEMPRKHSKLDNILVKELKVVFTVSFFPLFLRNTRFFSHFSAFKTPNYEKRQASCFNRCWWVCLVDCVLLFAYFFVFSTWTSQRSLWSKVRSRLHVASLILSEYCNVAMLTDLRVLLMQKMWPLSWRLSYRFRLLQLRHILLYKDFKMNFCVLKSHVV